MLVGVRSPLGLQVLQLIVFNLAKVRQILGVSLVLVEWMEIAELRVQLSSLLTGATGIASVVTFSTVHTGV